MLLIPSILSLTVHEWAHAWSAYKLGDDTAAMQGRMTLSPFAHIDPIGTVLLPLLGIPFGWAKPVPVNPARFRRDVHMSTGMAITAGAGPLSNLILSLVCAVALGLIYRFDPGLLARQRGVAVLLFYGLQLNIGLALFNLLPVPPLDGSRILERLLPSGMQDLWETFKRFAPLLLLVVISMGGFMLAGPRQAVANFMYEVIRSVAGARG